MTLIEALAALPPIPSMSGIESWLQQGFYPALFTLFVLASLGLPIPEDVPLLAAGVLLRTHPAIAQWPLTLLVSAVGIMSGDVILYMLGRHWGRNVLKHKSMAWIMTPERLAWAEQRFRVKGVWMVFFGRFVMGVRAAMCVSAGVTHFPFWRFFLADLCGAAITIPLFLGIGYWFAGTYARQIKWGLIVLGVVAAGSFIIHELVTLRRKRTAPAAPVPEEVAP